MRLVQVTHSRCAEYDGRELFVVPDTWSRNQVTEVADEVIKELIADAKALSAGADIGAPERAPRYDQHPEKTVAEVQRLWEEHRARYTAWQEENRRLGRSFRDRLRERGVLSPWDEGVDALTVSASWGHNHTLTLNYGEPKQGDGFGV